MKKLSIDIGLLFFILVALLSMMTAAQAKIDSNLTQGGLDAYKENYRDPDLLNKKGEAYYQKISSPDLAERQNALFFFSHFKKEDLNEKIMDAIIDLFKKEMGQNKGPYKVKKRIKTDTSNDIADSGEGYGIYQGYLCELAGKTGNKDLLPLLVEHCMDPKVIINFGDASIGLVIDKLSKTNNSMAKTNAIRVLGEMLKPKQDDYVAKGEIRGTIKKVLIQATSDDDHYVRSASVKALGASEDEDMIPLLEKIAQNDSAHFEKKVSATGEVRTIYPVREEAEKALKKIKGKGTKNN